jgi:hypothetical protein
MKLTKIPGLGRFGYFVDDVDLMTISDEEWMEIGKLHMQNFVTIIRNANCTKDRYGELIDKFGRLRPSAITSLKYKKKYKKDWSWVMKQVREDSKLIDEDDKFRIKVGEYVTERTENGFAMGKIAGGYTNGIPNGFFADGELLWHSNESGTLTFCPGVALMGFKNMIKSSTGFVTTPDYYESVSESFRSELNEMIILHRYTPNKINPGNHPAQDIVLHANMCPVDDSEVPLVIKSPGGITGLHYSVNTMHSIKGMTKKESDKVFKRIEKGLFQEKYIYDHWYQSDNDLLLFDNSITLHRRLGWIEGRVAYRIPHDYTNLQDGVYQPYFQPEFQKMYNTQIREIIKELGIKNFKLPSQSFKEKLLSLVGIDA